MSEELLNKIAIIALGVSTIVFVIVNYAILYREDNHLPHNYRACRMLKWLRKQDEDNCYVFDKSRKQTCKAIHTVKGWVAIDDDNNIFDIFYSPSLNRLETDFRKAHKKEIEEYRFWEHIYKAINKETKKRKYKYLNNIK